MEAAGGTRRLVFHTAYAVGARINDVLRAAPTFPGLQLREEPASEITPKGVRPPRCAAGVSVLDDVRLHLVETVDDADAFRRWLGERRPILGLDIETSGLSLAFDRIRLVQFGDGRDGWALPYEEWRGLIRHALATYDRPVVLQHAKFDAGFLLRDGLPFPWERVHDTMLMCFLVDSMGPKGLKPAAALYVDPVARAGESELKKAMAANRWTWGTVPIDLPVYWGYSAADTVLTALLAEKLWPRVQPYREAYDLELACERVLCGMELRGMMIDVPYVEDTASHLRAEIATALEGLPFNPNATSDVVAALQAEGITLTKRTEGGAFAVDDEVLSAIDHPIADAVLSVRSKSKLLTSYFENFRAYHRDGVLRPHINQLAARTGRMSVTEPALQTLPRKSIVRDAFVPRPGNLLVLADFDTQELRIAAHVSGDENMIRAFLDGRDLHMETARQAYGPNAGKPERTVCKNANYAMIYGAGPPTVAATARISLGDAAVIIAAFSGLYPGMNRMMAAVTAAVRERAGDSDYGYVVLGDGRRLRVPKAKAYTGMDFRIQGEGAVVMKRGLVNIDAAGLGDYLVLPVHDEVVFDIPEADVPDAVPAIREALVQTNYRVPLTVSTRVVDRWGTAYREDG